MGGAYIKESATDRADPVKAAADNALDAINMRRPLVTMNGSFGVRLDPMNNTNVSFYHEVSF